MKLDITEVYFLTQVTQNASIKASDATVVSDLMKKLDKLLQDFVDQHRMKLPGGTDYEPCYRIAHPENDGR